MKLREYGIFLDSTAQHLTGEVLSILVNLAGDLSEKERQFIGKHLQGCESCTRKFNEVFDDELDFDDERATVTVRSQLAVGTEGRRVLAGEGFEVEIQQREEKVFLSLRKMPSVCVGESMRIRIGSNVLLRLTSIRLDQFVEIPSDESAQISRFDQLDIEILAKSLLTKEGRLVPKTQTVGYLRYAAAAVVIVGLGTTLWLINRAKEDSTAVERFNERFAENAVLESFINRTTRAREEFAILEPAIR